MTYRDAKLAARAAKAERCLALSRDALAANIALLDAPRSTRFEGFQALEHAALVAGTAWAAAMVEPVVFPLPTQLMVQALPDGAVIGPVVNIDDPSTYPDHFRRVDP